MIQNKEVRLEKAKKRNRYVRCLTITFINGSYDVDAYYMKAQLDNLDSLINFIETVYKKYPIECIIVPKFLKITDIVSDFSVRVLEM